MKGSDIMAAKEDQPVPATDPCMDLTLSNNVKEYLQGLCIMLKEGKIYPHRD